MLARQCCDKSAAPHFFPCRGLPDTDFGGKSAGAYPLGMDPFAAPAPGFDEPLEMLAACHERIEAQLRTLEKLVEHLSQNCAANGAAHGADNSARDAAARVMRYFDTAGVEHHRDE